MKKHYTYYLLIILFVVSGFNVLAQNVMVGGTVLDKDTNTPLPGVTIVAIRDTQKVVKGSVILSGTATDANGKFWIKVPSTGYKLRFTFIGYQPVWEKITKAKADYHIYMIVEDNVMDDIITIGYQQKKKQDVTSSAIKIEAKDLPDVPVQNVMELLQGRVAGLNIQQNNGTPGMAGSYVIRGLSDINVKGSGDQAYLTDTSPLFVVDGIPIDNTSNFDYEGLVAGSNVSPLAMIPQEDIASITVLKDAQATAQYGSQGAYGVILITTKRGNSMVPIISYSSSMSISTPPRLKDVVVGATERRLRVNEILNYEGNDYDAQNVINSFALLSDSLNAYYNNNTDWQDVFYRTTYNQTHNINFSGGDNDFNYKVNVGYSDSKGIVDNTGFTRYSLRTNLGYQPNEKFRISAYVNTSIGKNSTGSGNALIQTGVASGANTSSLLPPPSLYTASNATLGALSVDNKNKDLSYDASISLNYQIAKGLSFNSAISYSHSTKTEDTFEPGMLNNEKPKITSNNTFHHKIYNRNNISYNTHLGYVRFGLSLMFELSSAENSGNNLELVGLPSDVIRGPVGYTFGSSSGDAKSTDDNKSISFMVNPSFGIGSPKLSLGEDKYVFTPMIRPEASSVSGSSKKWTINPGLGFAWHFSRESFMKRYNFISSGTMRITWGRTIRQNADIYDIYGKYYIADETYNGQSVIPINLESTPNPDLKPTTNTTWNFGMDMGFLRGKYSFSMDAYYKQTDNILKTVDMANHNAFTGVKSISTSLVNKGLEFQCSARPLPVRSKLDWNISFNFAIDKNIVTALPNGVKQYTQDGSIVNRVGTNALSNFLFVNKGVYANDEDVPVDPATGLRYRIGGSNSKDAYFKAGDPIWVDVNGDYILDDNDREIVGNSQPRITGGAYNTLRYGSVSVSVSLSFTLRRDIINKTLADQFATYYDPKSLTSLAPIGAYDFWTPEHRNAKYPNPFDYKRSNLVDPFRADQTLFQEDGSYVKLNNVSLSYNVNKKYIEKFGLSQLTFRFGINNLHVFTNYSGINPENVNSLGRDVSGGYPNSRDYSFGMSIKF